MLDLSEIARRASERLDRSFNDDPLFPASDRGSTRSGDEALDAHRKRSANLVLRETVLAPHRHRLLAMLAAQGLAPREIAADYWPELRIADRRCANCANSRYCERWLSRGHESGAAAAFCPNAKTFEQIKKRMFDARLVEWLHKNTAR